MAAVRPKKSGSIPPRSGGAKVAAPTRSRARGPMSPERAQSVLLEVTRRAKQAGILDACFPKQRAFVDDPSQLKAALCTRRAGKSYSIGLLLFATALMQPGVSVLYVALTKGSAKKIMHKDILRVINREYGIGATFNETTLEVTLPNGSVLYLLGADASKDEADKILGQKFALAVVDEAASFRQDLRHLCMEIILPTLSDYEGGQLLLIGTPGNVKNFFFEVTTGKVPGWSVHRWTAHDNPHIQWGKFLAKLLANNPRVQETPQFKQHYLGEWVVDTTLLCYPGYSAAANDVFEQPNVDGWNFLLAVDFGWSDATSLVLGAWSDHDPTLYILKARKRTKLTFTDVANWIKQYLDKFPIHEVVVDGAAKQGVEELVQHHGLPLVAADKRGKAEAMSMMSADLITGRVKVLQPHCVALTDEWGGLIWDEKKLPKYEEHPGCENHAADAALYLYRKATHYAATPKPREERRGLPRTTEEMEEYYAERDERLELEGDDEWWEKAG